MNINLFEEIILKFKNAIKNTEFENHLYIHGGYLRDLYYNLTPNDLDLILISNKNNDDNIFLESICSNFDLNKNDITRTSVNTFIFEIYKINIDLTVIDSTFNSNFIRSNHNSSDYTLNGLIQNVSTDKILEITDGVYKDLKNKRIKLFNDLNFVYKSTPNSILRLIKFYSRYNVKIPLSIIRYIKKNSYLMNFIDRDRIINEYNKILNESNSKNAIKLLNILNINPTDKNRFPIFFGNGWYELEPGKIPNRVIDGKKYRWSKNNAEIFIGNNINNLKLTFIKHPSIKSDFLIFYYDDNKNELFKACIIDWYNELSIDTCNYKKINILTDTYNPYKIENINDNRELGICLTDCHVPNFNIKGLEYVPYLI